MAGTYSIADLVTDDEVRNWLKINNANVVVDQQFSANLVRWKKAAHDKITTHLGYEFLRVSELVDGATVYGYVDERYNGSGLNCLYLRHRPIRSFTAIKEDDVAITITDIEIRDGVSLYFHDDRFSAGIGNYKITYDPGYVHDDLPDDIRACALDLIQLMTMTGAMGKASEANGASGASVSYDLDAESRLLAKLDPYVRIFDDRV